MKSTDLQQFFYNAITERFISTIRIQLVPAGGTCLQLCNRLYCTDVQRVGALARPLSGSMVGVKGAARHACVKSRDGLVWRNVAYFGAPGER